MSQMDCLRHLIIDPLVDGRTPQETWEKVRPQLMALRPLNVDLNGVSILACPIMEMSAASPSFVDLREFWREYMAEANPNRWSSRV